MPNSRAAGIVALEEALDERLRDHAAIWRSNASWVDLARQWSAAVWDRAESLGPASLAPDAVERGLALAARPVFVCGAHRSGTSMMRNLLDGHPALAVLPAEGSFYTSLERRLAGLPVRQQAAEIGREWLRRLVNPNSQPPFWLLGRSAPQASAYVDFARAFAAWWPILHARAGGAHRLWLLAAVALAYAGRLGDCGIAPGIARWVEKTPTNERFLARIWTEFPAARVIHVIRRPEAALASRKAVMVMVGRWPGREVAAIYRDLARSYRVALEQSRSAPADRYLLVRYEDMVAQPEAMSRRLAAFLDIDPLPILCEPTVAGAPASRNSSFGEGSGGGGLTRLERAVLAMAVGWAAARLGYA